MQTLVYQYKAKHPIVGAATIAEQVSLGHRYYNRLIELHREQWARTEDARLTHCPNLEAAEAATTAAEQVVVAMVDAIRSRNAAERRKRTTVEEAEAMVGARELLATERSIRSEERQRFRTDPDLQAELARIYEEYQGQLVSPDSPRRKGGHFKDARASCLVFWGTYLELEKSVEQAVKMSFSETGQPPRFRRWTGDGLVAVQIQGGMSWEDARSCLDTRLRVQSMPLRESKRAQQSQQHVLWLRVGSAGRDPVWAQVPFYLHRPLPSDARIMGVSLIRRQCGVRRHRHPEIPEGVWEPHYEWSVSITLRTEQRELKRPLDGFAGVDLGWRPMDVREPEGFATNSTKPA